VRVDQAASFGRSGRLTREIFQEHEEQQEQNCEDGGFQHPVAEASHAALVFALMRAFRNGVRGRGAPGAIEAMPAFAAAIWLAVERRKKPVEPLVVMRAAHLGAAALGAEQIARAD